ncbi:MAG: histidine kinase dimerization/phosphoacceptor domain -containing protein [Balneola sp.]
MSIQILPEDWASPVGEKSRLMDFFILNPAMLLGVVTLFWFGFEWSFIPVFLCMFIIGIFSSMNPFWAILFGMSFVFGLSIYAIVYHCVKIDYTLRSIKSVIIFIITSFIASTASSLGTFIWSLEHSISATETASIWNSWWSGSFLQAVFLSGAVIFIFSPTVEKWKSQLFEIPEAREVSTKWVYSTVVLITVVISIFIFSGDYLGKKRVSEEILQLETLTSSTIVTALDSFEIITWVSIWIVFCVGFGAIFLISSWNKELKEKVVERTQSLNEAEQKLKISLSEKTTLLNEIHHRVKNNLAVVIALLDLQCMRNKDPDSKKVLEEAKSRIKSMGFVHEILYKTEDFANVDFSEYLEKLCNSLKNTLRSPDKNIEIVQTCDSLKLPIEKAIPLGLLINEVIVNSYKHAFTDLNEGVIELSLKKNDDFYCLNINDNGVGFSNLEEPSETSGSLGMKLIKTLVKQLRGNLDVQSKYGETNFNLNFSLEAEIDKPSS